MSNTEVQFQQSGSLDDYDFYFECITSCHSVNGEDFECITACIEAHLDKEHKT